MPRYYIDRMNNRLVDNWHSPFVKRSLVILLLFLILLYGVVPQLKSFGLDMRFGWPKYWRDICLALVLLALSFNLAALNFWLLSFRKLHFTSLLLIQIASIIPSKLLPSGLGSMSTNYVYFRQHGFSSGASGVVSSMNNLVGAVVNLSLLGGLLIVAGSGGGLGRAYKVSWYDAAGALLVVVALLLVGYVWSGHIRRLEYLHRQMQGALNHYRQHWVYVLMLAFSAGCLAVVNVAVSAVLAFRMVSFWLPIIPGIVAVIIVGRRRMIAWPTAVSFLRK